MTIIEYLESKGCRFKGNGREVTTACIFCNDEKNHLYVNREKEVFHCVKCNEAGNIWKLKKHYGELPIYQPKKDKEYTRPEPSLITQLTMALGIDAMNYLTKERGFSLESIKKFNLGYKKDYISIPYYKNNLPVNIKYRNIHTKQYIREEGGESILYNIDRVNKTEDIILVEGEFDCISAWQLGFKNVISTSIGAGGFKDKWIEFFDACSGDIYLAYDNDEAGDKGAEKVIARVGKHRCLRIKLPRKDFNECLMAGYKKEELEIYFESAESSKPESLLPLSEALEKMKERLYSNKNIEGFVLENMPSLFEKLGGLRETEVTVVTGDTACGKSTYCLNIIYDLIKLGKHALVISSEMSPVSICGKFCSMYLGSPYYLAEKEDISEAIFELGKRQLSFVDIHGEITIENIVEYLRYVKHRYNVEYALLDHLHYFMKPVDNMVQEIERFMKKIVAVALETKINIFLIAHPSKLKNTVGAVTMNDVKGSSSIKQDSFNIITMWRDKKEKQGKDDEVVINVEKVRDEIGRTGKFRLKFDSISQRYSELKKE